MQTAAPPAPTPLPGDLCLHPHPAAQVVAFLSAPYHCHTPLLETGARRLKTHSFSWDFHLFAPSSLPLLCVNISRAEGGGKARSWSWCLLFTVRNRSFIWGTAVSGGRRMLNTQRFYINFVGLFLKKHVCFFFLWNWSFIWNVSINWSLKGREKFILMNFWIIHQCPAF